MTKANEKIILATFKDIANIDNVTYNGFKASIGAKDEDIFKKSELEKKLKKYKNQSAFINIK